jgi:tetratricopeptide (TPR) repeat protein
MRSAKWVIFAALTFLAHSFSLAGPLALQDPLAHPGFVHFYNNEFDEAVKIFEQETKLHANDPEAYNHLAQAILYREMLRNGALESELVSGTNPFLRRPKMAISPQVKAKFESAIDRSIGLSQASLEKDGRDIRALHALGVAHALRANYSFLVEKAWMDALREAMAARKFNEQILDIQPNFVDAQLILGLDEYVVGSLPFHMRAVGFVAGFHGDKQGGIEHLEQVSRRGVINRYDAEIILSAIYRRERCPQKAIPLLKDLAARFPRNYLLRFEQVKMYSDLGDKHSALQVLAGIDELRRTGAPGYSHLPDEKVKYLRANLLFWYGDLDPALADLRQVTHNSSDLDLGTVVMAWLRLGQVYDLKGNREQAVEAYRETMKTAPQSAAAMEAKSYISSPYRRKRTAG